MRFAAIFSLTFFAVDMPNLDFTGTANSGNGVPPVVSTSNQNS